MKRLRFNLLRITLTLVYILLLTLAVLTNLEQRIRSGLLKVILSLIYILVLAPIAWRKRRGPKSGISAWKDHGARAGWFVNEQSTSDKQLYASISSGRDDLVALMQKKGNDNCTLLVYDILRPLRFLAKPPKDEELSADLYVMF